MLVLASRCLTASKGDSEEKLGGFQSSPNWLLRQMRLYQISFLRMLLQDRSTTPYFTELINNLLQVFSVCAANASVHPFVQQMQVQTGCTANSTLIPANSTTISTLISRKAFLSDAITFDLADFWLWSKEKYSTKTAGQESGNPESATLFRSVHSHHEFLVVLCISPVNTKVSKLTYRWMFA